MEVGGRGGGGEGVYYSSVTNVLPLHEQNKSGANKNIMTKYNLPIDLKNF